MSIRTGLRALFVLSFVAVTLIPAAAVAAVRVDHLEGFDPQILHHVQMMVISEHFDASEKELKAAAQKLNTADEITAAFFLARQSGKRLQTVLKRRTAGASWWDLTGQLNVWSPWLMADMLRAAREGGLSALTQRQVRRQPMSDERFESLVGAQVTGQFFETAPLQVLQAHEQGQSFRDIQYTFFHAGRGGHAALHMAASQDLAQVVRASWPPVKNPVAPVEAEKVHRRPPLQRPSVQ